MGAPRGEAWRAERFEAGDWPSVAIVRRQFGDMSKALFAAGVRPRRGPTRARSHVLSDEEILNAIREWTRLYKEPPAIADWSPARARRARRLRRLDRYPAGRLQPSTNTISTALQTFSNFHHFRAWPASRHARAAAAAPRAPTIAVSTRAEVISPPAGRRRPRLRARAVARRPHVSSVAAARGANDPAALRDALIDLARRRPPTSGQTS